MNWKLGSTTKLFAEQSVSARQIDLDNLDERFRRASLNMVMATFACEKVLDMLPEGIAKDQIGMVLGTHFGEVGSTLEFLSTYYESQTSRPTLFQNGLHNSTLGFVSTQFGITGPGITVSCDNRTTLAAIDVAESLLVIVPFVLVCLVDSIPKSFYPFYLEKFPFINEFQNRATGMLLTRM